jgi:hypothetical protein
LNNQLWTSRALNRFFLHLLVSLFFLSFVADMVYIRFFVLLSAMTAGSMAQCDAVPHPAITAAPVKVNVSVNGRAPDVPDA